MYALYSKDKKVGNIFHKISCIVLGLNMKEVMYSI